MKIAYDAKRFFHNSSGLGNYSRDLVRILATHHPENSYLLLDSAPTEKGSDITALESVSVLQTKRSFLSRQLKMGLEAEQAGAGIFHGLSGELPLKWSPDSAIKKVVTIHDLIFLRYPKYYSWTDRKIHLWKFRKAAENADLVIAISEQTKRDIVKFLQIPSEKIKVVYQGCHEAFKSVANPTLQDSLKQKYHLPERFILSVGTIESRKNLLSTVAALQDTEIPLVVVGRKTGYYKKVEKYIRKHKMQKQILFLEGLDMPQLAELYKMADIFVYPSLFEGFGIPVIEALFSGTPVITGNTSSLPEAGGPDSMYVNPQNVQDLKSKFLFLWNSEAERERRAEKGKEYAQRFTDSRVAEDLINAYETVLNKKS